MDALNVVGFFRFHAAAWKRVIEVGEYKIDALRVTHRILLSNDWVFAFDYATTHSSICLKGTFSSTENNGCFVSFALLR